MVQVGPGSIYLQMYTWGLKEIPLSEIEQACFAAGKQLRQKDIENYYNGVRNHRTLNPQTDPWVVATKAAKPSDTYMNMSLPDYPENPYMHMPNPTRKWVPCNADNKPMCKWSVEMYERNDALARRGAKYVGENLRGGKLIVIDCDGDHDPDNMDLDLLSHMWQYSSMTHVLAKPSMVLLDEGPVPSSYHLTFWTDRIIPTMHFPHCHIDICGNKENQLRYWKNKQWNGLEPAEMTAEIWEQIKQYIKGRKNDAIGLH